MKAVPLPTSFVRHYSPTRMEILHSPSAILKTSDSHPASAASAGMSVMAPGQSTILGSKFPRTHFGSGHIQPRKSNSNVFSPVLIWYESFYFYLLPAR